MNTNRRWHYNGWLRRGQLANGGGHGDPDRLKDLAAGPVTLTARNQASVALFDDGHVKRIEILLDMRPFENLLVGFEPAEEFLFENQRQEATKHMATDGIVRMMIDRSGLQQRFVVAKVLLHLPELLVPESHLLGGKLGVGAKPRLPPKRTSFSALR
jgi:hypothetical protein